MYHNPRRPFYNTRSQDIPHDNTSDSALIDSKRFWKLLKKLTLRQEEAKEIKVKSNADDVANAAG
jgi:hypothetical protein